MRKLIFLFGVGAAIAIGITLWLGRESTSPAVSTTAVRVEAPPAASPVTPRAAPAPAVVDEPPAAPVVAEPLTADVEDGDNHGHAGNEQGEILPLREPPPSRDAFGADPESETAVLAEVRATLEALLNDPDPAVKEQASALLETIASP